MHNKNKQELTIPAITRQNMHNVK